MGRETPEERLAEPLARATGGSLAVAESCTGGLVADRITAVAGSSAYFDRGWWSTPTAPRRELLGVDERLLEREEPSPEPAPRPCWLGLLHVPPARAGRGGDRHRGARRGKPRKAGRHRLDRLGAPARRCTEALSLRGTRGEIHARGRRSDSPAAGERWRRRPRERRSGRFVALELPDERPRELGELKKRLAKRLPDFRWMPPGALHLTVSFLGDLSPETVRAPRERLSTRGFAGGGPLELFPSGLGAFPSPERARVLWVGAGRETRRVWPACAMNLEAGLEPLGIAREAKPFRPHLTLGAGGRAAPRCRPGHRGIRRFSRALRGRSGEVVLLREPPGPEGGAAFTPPSGLLR